MAEELYNESNGKKNDAATSPISGTEHRQRAEHTPSTTHSHHHKLVCLHERLLLSNRTSREEKSGNRHQIMMSGTGSSGNTASTHRRSPVLVLASWIRRLTTTRQQWGMLFWMILGVVCYSVTWTISLNDTTRTYKEILIQNQQQEIYYKSLDLNRMEQRRQNRRTMDKNGNRQRGGSLRKSQAANEKLEDTTTTTTNSQQEGSADASSEHSKNAPPPEDDFPFLSLWLSMMILSYYRMRMEPQLRRSRMYQDASTNTPTTLRRQRLSRNEQQEAVARTLRRINQERLDRGQEPISLESYRAFQHVLMTDRSIWRVLATRPQQAQPPPGATPEQLQACPIHTFTEEASSNSNATDDCTICLCAFQNGNQLRTLPCRHAFHVDCIDRWLQQSTLCPICKTSMVPEHERQRQEQELEEQNPV